MHAAQENVFVNIRSEMIEVCLLSIVLLLMQRIAGASATFRMTEKGVEFKGGSLHDGFGGFDGCGDSVESTLPSFAGPKLQDKEATVTVLTPLALLVVIQAGKKAHRHKLFGPVALGTTPGLSQGQTEAFSLGQTHFVPGTNPLFLLLFYTMEAQFVAVTSPVCPWDNLGDEGRHKEFTY